MSQLAWVAALSYACGEAPAPQPAPEATPDAEVVAPDDEPDAAPSEAFEDPLAGLPLPSSDVLWGVSIPVGCTPKAAQDDWIRFVCAPQLPLMERYYKVRFPLSKVTVKGNGVRIDPGTDLSGYARVRPLRRGPAATTLMVFRAGADAQSPVALRLRRLIPASPSTPR